jgi:hypothetical protein
MFTNAKAVDAGPYSGSAGTVTVDNQKHLIPASLPMALLLPASLSWRSLRQHLDGSTPCARAPRTTEVQDASVSSTIGLLSQAFGYRRRVLRWEIG